MMRTLPVIAIFSTCVITLSGCSSVTSHTGGNRGYYQGIKANNATIGDDNAGWSVKSLAVIDYPFSAVMDTLLLPWDYYRNQSQDDSLRARVMRSEQKTHPQAVIAQTEH